MPTFDLGGGANDFPGPTGLVDWQTARKTAARDGTPEVARVFSDQNGVSLTGWTNIDDAVYVEIVGQTPMDGTLDTGVLISRTASDTGALAFGSIANLRLKNLRFHNSGTSNAHGTFDFGTAVITVTVDNCIVLGNSTGDGFGNHASNAASGFTYTNCICTGASRGFNANTGAMNPKVDNCLAYKNGYGILNAVAKNSISLNSTVLNFFSDSASSDYNLSGDTSGNGANTKKSVTATASLTPGAGTWAGFTDLTAGAEDFNPIAFTDGATNWLLDLANAADAPALDMKGTTRSGNGTGPDKGPLELVVGGGGSPAFANPFALLGVGRMS